MSKKTSRVFGKGERGEGGKGASILVHQVYEKHWSANGVPQLSVKLSGGEFNCVSLPSVVSRQKALMHAPVDAHKAKIITFARGHSPFSRYAWYVETNRVITDPRRNFARISWQMTRGAKMHDGTFITSAILTTQRALIKFSRQVSYTFSVHTFHYNSNKFLLFFVRAGRFKRFNNENYSLHLNF